jgi:beta-glucosidase-like glycosyl hydrolase/CubicO group peptidase (beta-lactamase class C family)
MIVKKHQLSLLLTLAALLLGVQQALAVRPSILNRANAQEMEKWVEATYLKMSPQERVSQIMIMAINPGEGDVTKAIVKKYVDAFKVGGLIYERSDIATQADITNYAQSLSSIPLMIALDAEWGLTMRLKDAPVFPRNLLLGGINDDRLLYEYGKEVARECRLMGVHVNFAPVLDVLDREGSVVRTRSFGFSPEVVARHGVAFAKGLEDGGVLSTAKHFPGHGSTAADSHKELPFVDKSFKEMRMYDLVPFDSYVNAGLGGMLTAHIDVSFFDDGTTPCSMSKACVEGLLKHDMGFEGLVFTDALDMEGAKSIPGDPCVNAILAGNDVLLMPRDIEASINAVMAAIEDGTISWRDVETRCKKMLRYKYALGIIDSAKNPIDVDKVASKINTEYAQDLNRRLIAAAVTVAVNNGNELPIKNVESGKIQVLSLGVGDMFQKRCSSYANIKTCSNSSAVSADNSELIIAIGDEGYISEALAAAARKSKHVIVVVLDAPEKMTHYADLLTDSNVDAVVLGYGNDEVWQDYAAQTVFGGSPADGVLPVIVKSIKNHKGLRAGYGVKYAATRLGYTLPVEVGFNDKLLSRIDSICNYGISQKAFPGCQVMVVRHGKVVVDRSYGEINFDSGIPVTENTLFGLASVSKASGTLSGIMKLYDEGKIKLDEPASKYIEGLRDTDKSDLTFRQLLYHETGMQPSLSMWEMMFDPTTYSGKLITDKPTDVNTIKVMKNAYGNKDAQLRTDILASEPSREFNIAIAEGIYGGKVTYDSIMNRIYHSKLRPNKNYCYSCLNFCLLANALQSITHTGLDAFVDKNIFGKLGSYHTTYRPLNKFAPEQIAYTEVDTYLRKQHIHGYVHDELAAFSGGVQGNAGLFSNANDLAKLFQMWLNGGEYGGVTYYKKSTVDTFLKSKSPNSHRGLGFDKPNLKNKDASSTCDEATAETVGHTGFTGTCYWIDPKNDMIYIFLSNRVCPTRDNPAFSRVSARSNIHSLLYHSIEQ